MFDRSLPCWGLDEDRRTSPRWVVGSLCTRTSAWAQVFSVILFALGGVLLVSTARAIAPPDTCSSEKYWIFLQERPGSSPGSEAARWTQPVAPSYLNRLHEAGVRPLVRSRWFHAVSARLSRAQRRAVDTLAAVQGTRQVHSGSAHRQRSVEPRLVGPWDGPLPAPDSLPYGPSRQHLAQIHALPPLERGLNGHGVRIGFLDAHYRGLRHPVFDLLRREERRIALRNITEYRQGGSHGSAVASVAVGWGPGSLVGPAYGAEVLGASTEYTAFERNVEEDYFVAGLEWLHQRGTDVVNVSVGYTQFDEGQHSYTPDDLDGDTALTTRAVDRAAQLGLTVVVSAGNDGCSNPDSCWYGVSTPADADSAIAVGAVAPDSTLAPFTPRGLTADGRRKPDVLVQGQNVVTAWKGARYSSARGTSFASPQVTGIVAQMLQLNPTLTPVQVRRILRRTASQGHTPDSTRGWGIVNAEAAVRTAEWNARRNPPDTLSVLSPYRRADVPALIVPVRAPSGVSSVQLSLLTPVGEQVRTIERAAHPGPNRLQMSLKDISPGRYRYWLKTNAGHQTSGPATIRE